MLTFPHDHEYVARAVFTFPHDHEYVEQLAPEGIGMATMAEERKNRLAEQLIARRQVQPVREVSHAGSGSDGYQYHVSGQRTPT